MEHTPLSVYLLHNRVCRVVILNVNSLSRLYAAVANLQDVVEEGMCLSDKHKQAGMCTVM